MMGYRFRLNPGLNTCVLHIWVCEDNPSGMYEDWNPNGACA
jgi:hypothetical protein